MCAIGPEFYEFIKKLDENDGKLPSSLSPRFNRPVFEYNNSTCHLCNGYYGPSFGEPVCVTCHAFLYPDIPQLVPSSYTFSDKTDDGDSGNDEPSEMLYNDRRFLKPIHIGILNWSFFHGNSLDSETSPEDEASGASNSGPSGSNAAPSINSPAFLINASIFGPNGINYVSSGSNFGPSGNNPIPSSSNFSPNGTNPIPSSSNFGPSGNKPIPSSSNFGPSGSNTAPSINSPAFLINASIFGPNGINYVSRGSNFGPNGTNPIPSSSNFGISGNNPIPSSSNFGSTGNNPIPSSSNFGSTGNNSIPSSSKFGLSANNPIPSSSNFGSSGNNPIPSSSNFGSSGNKPIPSSSNFGLSANNPIPSSSNFGSSGNNPIPSSSHFGSSGNNSIPSSSKFGLSTNNPIPSSSNFGSSGNNPLPSSSNFGSSGNNCIPSSSNFGSSGNNSIPSSSNFGLSGNNPIPSSSNFGLSGNNPIPSSSNFGPSGSGNNGGGSNGAGPVSDDVLDPPAIDNNEPELLPPTLARSLAALSTPRLPDNLAPGLVEQLPSEVLLCIFSYMDDLSLCACALVCARWWQLVRARVSPLRWRAFVARRWPLFQPLVKILDWHRKYQSLVESCFCRYCVVQMCAQWQPPYEENAWRRNRLRNELKMLRNDPPEGCAATPLDPKCCHWQAMVTGPAGSPYEGGIFYLYIQVPYSYPMSPPVVRFLTRILHPNVSRHGDLGIDSVHHNWSLALTISKVLISIQSLLTDPYTAVCMEPEVGDMYVNDRARFEKLARRWTWRYAMHHVLVSN